ncbi:Ti-type conjugative transfer relaxase TraA [Aureimonas pseudogalii]|uniref:Ti-type conjugative transfer relaxase TraA n=1 Tax=Aureimonas pseudogalii TaxID=1744844 RepID=A0A7W6MLU1_9HYPH|nr:Ti-type conjugative transfer relaxase TraA [Aureimonas pseudogalii]MBB4000120.1 Ti-type conjugative transfer relaxase TraA [Aureimonas pseudogalii]
MAIYSFRQSAVTGGSGRSAVAAAAYRHAVVMTCELTGIINDFSGKQGGVHSELAIPSDAPDWIRQKLGFTDPETAHLVGASAVTASQALWNTVETGEKRGDALYATDLIVALPRELTEAQNIELIRDFVRVNYTEKGKVVDWAYHAPEDRLHNPHAHIMATVRPLTEIGFGPKTIAQLDAEGIAIRSDRGAIAYTKWAGSKRELYANREAWAGAVNVALAEAGLDISVDHRSFRDRGIIDIEPTTHHGIVHHIGAVREPDIHVQADLAARSRNFQALVANPSLVLEQITREQSTFDTRDVARFIHRYAGEGDDFASLHRRVGALPELVTIQAQIHDPETDRIVQRERFTTTIVLEREAAMIASVERRSADVSFAVDPERKEIAIGLAQETQGFAYTAEQRSAVDRLTLETGLSSMVGIAGAGKSTVLRAVNEVYTAEGATVVGAALAGKAADNLQVSSGIESRTLASWENAWSKGYDRLAPGSVFVIDEAGMVASAQMARVVAELDKFGAKVILVGDARQLQPIEAGAAFRSIANEVGYVELTEVRRQERSDHAEASVHFGAGDAKSALNIYHGNDTFRPHDRRADALTAAIEGWHIDWRANVDVVMLAHTNVDVRVLNQLARAAIQAEGGLADERTMMTARGQREFAVGDRVIFLDNDRQLSIRNGSIGTVDRFENGTMFVAVPERKQAVPVAPGGYINIDHGYATTIHKSQGSTHDRVHIVAGGMMDAQLTYVALSRHREEVTMHVPLESFTRPGAPKLATVTEAMERLATDKLKDTSIDYRTTQDYMEARKALEAERAISPVPESLIGRFRAFLEERGLPDPADVLHSVRQFAAEVLARARSPEAGQRILVPETLLRPDQAPDPKIAPSPELVSAIHRLDHVQQHSAAMNHEGLARRSAFRSAENELTLMRTSTQLTSYAERVAAIVPPTLVVAIGRDAQAVLQDTRLDHLADGTRRALHENWIEIHAVSRAAWELGLLETVRSIDASYRHDRIEATTLKEYERSVAAAIQPVRPIDTGATDTVRIVEAVEAPQPFISAVTRWPVSIEQAVTRTLEAHPEVTGFLDVARKQASIIWRDPDAALGLVQAALPAHFAERRIVLDAVASNPQQYGELNGGRTLLMRPDATRQKAVDMAIVFSRSINNVRETVDLLRPGIMAAETQWRDLMAKPMPTLSPEAAKVVEALVLANGMKRPDREPAHEIALKAISNRQVLAEVTAWRKELDQRLAVPDAVNRIPEISTQKASEIQTTAATVDVALKEARNTQRIEIERERSITINTSPDISI